MKWRLVFVGIMLVSPAHSEDHVMKFSDGELAVIVNVLGEAPYSKVAGVISSIQTQIRNEQVNKLAPLASQNGSFAKPEGAKP